MFGHEKFKAYQLSIEFLKVALTFSDSLPPGYSSIKDQLKRAAMSIPLNIAEGSGKTSFTDKKRFYSIARGSAMECAAICDVLQLIDKQYFTKVGDAKDSLKSIVSILSSVCFK